VAPRQLRATWSPASHACASWRPSLAPARRGPPSSSWPSTMSPTGAPLAAGVLLLTCCSPPGQRPSPGTPAMGPQQHGHWQGHAGARRWCTGGEHSLSPGAGTGTGFSYSGPQPQLGAPVVHQALRAHALAGGCREGRPLPRGSWGRGDRGEEGAPGQWEQPGPWQAQHWEAQGMVRLSRR